MPLGVGVQQKACLGDGRLLADAGHDILQRPAIRRRVMRVVGGEDGAAVLAGEAVEPFDPGIVVAAIQPACRHVTQ